MHCITTESVSEGHPDKIADQIADAILDGFLLHDPFARVAVEVMVVPDVVILGGEISSIYRMTQDELEDIVRNVVRKIGYERSYFHWKYLRVLNFLHEQSNDIAIGVLNQDIAQQGAGDQGIMFGYACTETEELMPAGIVYAHKILQNIMRAVRNGDLKDLGPDAKSQITLNYTEPYRPVSAASIVVSIQHHPNLTQRDVREAILPYVIAALPRGWMCPLEKFYVNYTGKFVTGGPQGDAGMTGRKIIVDSYGSGALHGGGAFSGKDPSKVDRSGAYAARYLAKNIVAAGLGRACTIQLAYVIGKPEPISIYATTHRLGVIEDADLVAIIPKLIDLRPNGIRLHLGLNKPMYSSTSVYGHFGRQFQENGAFSWERTDLVDKILQYVKGV